MDWKKITSHLYENINPIKGELHIRVDEWTAKKKCFSNLYIEFDMNEFIYEDPLYGEQSSKSSFNRLVELMEIPFFESVEQIHHLQNLEISHDPKARIGCFSNSLHFTVPKLKFGKIENMEIELEMEYSLTNSDSYPSMDGSIDDHLQSSGTISQKIKIKELLFTQLNNRPISNILNHLDPTIYDIEKVHKNLNSRASRKDRTQYVVPYKNIIPKPKKKWWQF